MNDFVINESKIMTFDNKPKTEMKIGNITIYNTKSFAKFQKKMIKWCFGFDEINDIT